MMMKLNKPVLTGLAALAAVSFGALSGCSTVKSVTGQEKSAEEVAASSGPAIVNSRVNPGTIELTRDLKPKQQAEILAEIKDYTNKVTDVRLRFIDVPVEVKMQNVAGTTWRASLTPELLKKLAIGNQTTTYEANIFAKNAEGKVGVSKDPLKVAVKAPDLSKSSG